MSDQDQAEKDAESLLPNAWWARPAVAAALRERASLLATADALNKSLREALDHQGAEIERLKVESAAWEAAGLRRALQLEPPSRPKLDWRNAILDELALMKAGK